MIRRLTAVLVVVGLVVGLAGCAQTADLTGPFQGTQSFVMGGGCDLVHQRFAASYEATIGTVDLEVEGCAFIVGTEGTYDGVFALTVDRGTVFGTAVGTIRSALPGQGPGRYNVTLTVTSAVGRLAAVTGRFELVVDWAGFPATNITGSVAAA